VYPWLTRHPGSGGLTEIAIGEGAGVRGHFDTSLECVTVCVEEMKHFVRQARSHHVAAHVLGVDDEANPLFGQYLFEVFGADRVVEIPVANGKADAQVVGAVRFNGGATGDRHPALAFTDWGGDNDRSAGVAA
jgi:hypothetical protein